MPSLFALAHLYVNHVITKHTKLQLIHQQAKVTAPVSTGVSQPPADECAECETVAESTGDGQVEIPTHAPSWLHDLSKRMRFLDRLKLYDVTGHLLFDSLLSIQGIKHFYYFAQDESARRMEDAFSRTLRGKNHGKPSDYAASGSTDDRSSEVRVAFHLGDNVSGHRNIVHGGLIATLIDEVSGASAFAALGPCFTANLNVNYLRPMTTNQWVLVRSHVYQQQNRKAFVETTVEDGYGHVYSKGTALFIRPRVDVQEHAKQSQSKASTVQSAPVAG